MANYTGEQIFFQEILKIFVWLVKKAYGLNLVQGEVKLMANYVVKDDNPDVGFSLSVGEVTDAEGQVITDAQLTKEVSSTDDSVLAFTDAGAGDGSGSVKFGAPGQASLQYSVKDATGKILGSGSDGFTVTTGDPAAVTGIVGTFEGLTPVEEVAPNA